MPRKSIFVSKKPNKALEKADPLADAVMVYVAESGASKEETEANLEKLEKEKKMAIELRKRVNFSLDRIVTIRVGYSGHFK